jgi:hypothetical protein
VQSLTAARRLLLVGAETSTKGVNATNQYGESALHVACKREDVERIQALLRDGADLAAVDKSAWTVLHQAVESCNPDVVKAVLGTRSTSFLGGTGGGGRGAVVTSLARIDCSWRGGGAQRAHRH